MKQIITTLALLILLTSAAFTQNNYSDPIYPEKTERSNKNFKIANGEIQWQKIYNTTLDITAIARQLQTNGTLRDVQIIDDATIIAVIDHLDADYKGAGHTRGTTPIYLISDRLSASVTINIKPGRFRATVRNIQLTTALETAASPLGESEPLETYALKKKNTQFKDGFLNIPATILDHTFHSLFDLTPSPSDDNW